MVAVVLKGVHTVTKRLKSGRLAVYYYAWRSGPRLTGAPGSPEFVRCYTDAHAARKRPEGRTLAVLIARFKASPDYTRLGAHSKRAYGRFLSDLTVKFGAMDLAVFTDPGVKEHVYGWRDTMAATPRTADYAMGTLRVVLEWGKERGLVGEHQFAKIKRLHRADRSDEIWTADDLAAFKAKASKELTWAVEVAMHTGLRQGDLLALTWNRYDGEQIQVRTSKRGKFVQIPVTAECRALLERIDKRALTILTTARTKRPWTSDGFRASFGAAKTAAKVSRHFHDLRGNAVTNYVRAGFSDRQVAEVIGWSEEAVSAISRRYVSRSAVVADMVAKLEKGG